MKVFLFSAVFFGFVMLHFYRLVASVIYICTNVLLVFVAMFLRCSDVGGFQEC